MFNKPQLLPLVFSLILFFSSFPIIAQPNLVCEVIGFGDLIIEQNSFTHGEIIVRNTGDSPAGTSTLGYYLSTDQTITRDDFRVGEVEIGALAPGEFETKSFTRSFSGIPNGTYYLGMFADDLSTVTETSGEDNTCFVETPRITIGPQSQPDLVTLIFDDLTISGNTLLMDGLIDYCNIGSGYAGSSHVGLYLSLDTDFTTDDILIAEEAVGPVPVADPELCALIFFDEEIEITGVPAGEYYVGIITDHRNEVDEGNEENNTNYFESSKVVIEGTNEEEKPNIVCGNLGELTVNGNQLEVSDFEVTNTGEATAGASIVGFYLSLDNNISREDIRIGERSVASLTPGQTRTVNFSSTLSGIDEGTYFLGMVVDDTGTVPETSGEDNFCYYESPKVLIEPFSEEKPNLVCESLEGLVLNEASLFCGGISILNAGDASSNPSKAGFYLSTDETITREDFRLGEVNVPALDPGAREQTSFDRPFDGLPDGNYFFGMILDDAEVVEESSENDNTCFIDLPKVILGDEAKPDLDIQNFGNITVLGDSLLIIEEFIEVCNKGTAYVGESVAGLYLSLDSNITSDDLLIAEEGVEAIPVSFPEFCDEVLFEGQVSLSSIPDGEYFVGIIVDHLQAYAESDETNNTHIFSSSKVVINTSDSSACTLDFSVSIQQEAQCLQANGTAQVELPVGIDSIQIVWDNGEVGPRANELTYGMHTVQLVQSEFCRDTLEFSMTGDSVLILPQVDFEVQETDSILHLYSLATDYDSLNWTINGSIMFSGEEINLPIPDGQEVEIRLTAFNSCGKASTTEVYPLSNQITLSPKSIGSADSFNFFPNPSKGKFTLLMRQTSPSIEIFVYNSLGQNIHRKNYSPKTDRVELDFERQPSGIYHLLIKPFGRDEYFQYKMEILHEIPY